MLKMLNLKNLDLKNQMLIRKLYPIFLSEQIQMLKQFINL